MSRERDQEPGEKDQELRLLRCAFVELKSATAHMAFDNVSCAVRTLGDALEAVELRYADRPPTPYVVFYLVPEEGRLRMMRTGSRTRAEATELVRQDFEGTNHQLLGTYALEDLRELVRELEAQTGSGVLGGVEPRARREEECT